MMMVGLGLGMVQVAIRRMPFVGGGGDVTPPGTVSDLAQDLWDGSELDVSFTVPGDNAFSAPVASQYEIRFRIGATITSDADWNAATLLVGPWASIATVHPDWVAGGVGSEATTLPGIPGQTYFVAIRFKDAAGNMSGISNNVSVSA